MMIAAGHGSVVRMEKRHPLSLESFNQRGSKSRFGSESVIMLSQNVSIKAKHIKIDPNAAEIDEREQFAIPVEKQETRCLPYHIFCKSSNYLV